jgi:DNA invertase Pin-like site-specific DNA recombinase
MARCYSEQLMLRVNRLDADRTGVKLAKACIKGNIPALHVSRFMGVSRMTVHNWFNGLPIRDKNEQKAKKLLRIMEEDFTAGVLPVATIDAAKNYLSSVSTKLDS